ncbi:hypothetical protein [Botrytis cinerea fusarivirus 3]|uniref:Uncharacterized protein n=1 Tax=Botrytis cinerea fusarivirus 3 TaxID=2735919 RepID=A0AAE7AP48_9VIRU|nr:hypothetical protein QKS26_gp2 [Botrytis cinerea fusarivirus 3]QJT73715.1 hypothetical protein [Botrytis cinerea fusarivirus 3]
MATTQSTPSTTPMLNSKSTMDLIREVKLLTHNSPGNVPKIFKGPCEENSLRTLLPPLGLGLNKSPMEGLVPEAPLFKLNHMTLKYSYATFAEVDEEEVPILVALNIEEVKKVFGVLIAPFNIRLWVDPDHRSVSKSFLVIMDAEMKHAIVQWDLLLANAGAYSQMPGEEAFVDGLLPMQGYIELPILSATAVFQMVAEVAGVQGFIGYYGLAEQEIIEPVTPLTGKERKALLPGYLPPSVETVEEAQEEVEETPLLHTPPVPMAEDERTEAGYESARSTTTEVPGGTRKKGKGHAFEVTRDALAQAGHPGYTKQVDRVWAPMANIAEALKKASDPYMAKLGRHLVKILQTGGLLTSQGLRKLLTVSAMAVMAYNVPDRLDEVKKELEVLMSLNRTKSPDHWVENAQMGKNMMWAGAYLKLRKKVLPGPRKEIQYIGPIWPQNPGDQEALGKRESWAHWVPRQMAQAEGLLDITSRAIQKAYRKLGKGLRAIKKFMLAKLLNFRLRLFPELSDKEVEKALDDGLDAAVENDNAGLGITAKDGASWLTRFANWLLGFLKAFVTKVAAAKTAATSKITSFFGRLRLAKKERSLKVLRETLWTPYRVRKANDAKTRVMREWIRRNPEATAEDENAMETLVLRRVQDHYFGQGAAGYSDWSSKSKIYRTDREDAAFEQDLLALVDLGPILQSDGPGVEIEEKDLDMTIE